MSQTTVRERIVDTKWNYDEKVQMVKRLFFFVVVVAKISLCMHSWICMFEIWVMAFNFKKKQKKNYLNHQSFW